ncbi:MAG: histidine kinase [Planctomycetes bacterium]|nr:histidine kinase [Planctomycetota bacterium]
MSNLRREIEDDADRGCATVEAIPLPLLVVQSVDNTVLFANTAVEETFGYRRRRLVGRDWSCLVPRISDRRKLKKLASYDGRVRGLEVQGKRQDNSTIWLSVWQQRIVFHSRECLLIILIDITREKLDGEQLERRQVVLKQLLELSDQDRELIACDIHDGVIQDMTGALMHLQAARRAIENGKPGAVDQLKNVIQMLRDGISEARRLIDGVRPPDLERVGLIGAIALLVERTASTKGIDIQFSHDVRETRLSDQAENSLYRIVQECLNNVWQHSKSERARVELIQSGRTIRMTVKDWGVGFDTDHSDDHRFGLVGVRQRARLLGGTVLIRSAVGKGCTVRVTIPLEKAKSQAPTG